MIIGLRSVWYILIPIEKNEKDLLYSSRATFIGMLQLSTTKEITR